MTLEFGYIQRYDKKGFGFVSKELSFTPQSREIYFHIKTIQRKYAKLGQTLDNGGWHGVCFWYVTEHTRRGDAVGDVWLTAAELPQDLQGQLLSLLESYWNSSHPTSPRWLDKVPIDKIGEAKLAEWKDKRNRRLFRQKQAEQKQREEESLARLREEQANRMVDLQNIKAFCNQHGITTVVHFTRIENLSSILKYGLLSRSKLDSMKMKCVFNDNQRIDRHHNAICTSISFPNYKMLYRYKLSAPKKWAVLLLHASLLWELECAFCQENAASNKVTCIMIQKRKSFSSLQLMFSDLPNHSRHTLRLPDHYPTNPQAEVLVLDSIPARYIKAIHFEQNSAELLTSLNRVNPSIEKVYDKQYFGPRTDYIFWKKQGSSSFDNTYDDEIPF